MDNFLNRCMWGNVAGLADVFKIEWGGSNIGELPGSRDKVGVEREPSVNIGFFGGSFDPIHRGHIALARAAVERCGLRQVLFVTCGAPPHKQKDPITPFIHRHAMVALATQEEKLFVPSLAEEPDAADEGRARPVAREGGSAKRGSPQPKVNYTKVNYTIDTVRRLKTGMKKADRLFVLVGIDAFRDIANWHEASALLGECEFIVASRPGYSLREVAEALPKELRPPEAVTRPFHKQPASGDLVLPGVTLHLLEGVHQNVAATTIREAAAHGKPLARWVDPNVAEYIRKMGLYR
jgi:nicotinate-nucleotide adenylyltransferase